MILWSAALAAFLLLSVWGAANWKAFHLVYCKSLINSPVAEKQLSGLQKLVATHFCIGMSRERIATLLYPLKMSDADISQALLFRFGGSVPQNFDPTRQKVTAVRIMHPSHAATKKDLQIGEEFIFFFRDGEYDGYTVVGVSEGGGTTW